MGTELGQLRGKPQWGDRQSGRGGFDAQAVRCAHEFTGFEGGGAVHGGYLSALIGTVWLSESPCSGRRQAVGFSRIQEQ